MRRIVALLLVMLLACAGACAQQADALDTAMGRLSVMSQRDEAFEGVGYYNGHLSARGCQPVCVANAVIASFGVEDRETAIGLVKEATELLVVERMRGKGRMELSRLAQLLDAQARREEAQRYPYFAGLIGSAPERITVLEEHLDAQMVAGYFEESPAPSLLVGRQAVYPDWEGMIGIIDRLNSMGMRDATLCLSSVGGGKKDSGTPLGSGKSGHYLSVLIHVGAFMDEGRVYVLDSLPRALEGEDSGYTCQMHEAYSFAQKKTAFTDAFDVERIQPTVLRLTQRDTQAWKEAALQEKAKRMKTLILYGPGALMIHSGKEITSE